MKVKSSHLNTFKRVVEITLDISQAYKPGIQAFGAIYSSYLTINNPRLLDGSVAIDEALKRKYPKDNRWDFVVSYDRKAYYIEIHPVTNGEVNKIIAKRNWLEKWLQAEAKELDKYPSATPRYFWLQSGRCGLLRNSIEYKKAAQEGLLPQKGIIFR